MSSAHVWDCKLVVFTMGKTCHCDAEDDDVQKIFSNAIIEQDHNFRNLGLKAFWNLPRYLLSGDKNLQSVSRFT